ncbi:MAG: PExPT-CTERM protein [Acidobacteria bacterium]|nr:PExPT-CTERM protein [Acidobacteriota bacterium]
MKKLFLLLGFTIFLSAALPLHAQGGEITSGTCDNSPENPTIVLAVVGSAGAFLASARARMKARRNMSTTNETNG